MSLFGLFLQQDINLMAMKHIIVGFFLALALASCTAGRNAAAGGSQAPTAAARGVAAAVSNRHFTIDVDYMQPMRGPQRSVQGGYALTVKGDTLVSYLPYFGEVYGGSTAYGAQKALNFEAPITRYEVTEPGPGLLRVSLATATDEDSYVYYIEVYSSSGKSYIDVQARNRNSISFTGELRR